MVSNIEMRRINGVKYGRESRKKKIIIKEIKVGRKVVIFPSVRGSFFNCSIALEGYNIL